jgi:hypothetical protein
MFVYVCVQTLEAKQSVAYTVHALVEVVVCVCVGVCVNMQINSSTRCISSTQRKQMKNAEICLL